MSRRKKTYVRAAGAALARQTVAYDASGNAGQAIEFEQWDASGMSYRRTSATVPGTQNGIDESGESDPAGGAVGLDGSAYEAANEPPERDFALRQPRSQGDTMTYQNGQWIPCLENGYPTSCARVRRNMENGSAAQCPSGGCGPQTYYNGSRYVLSSPFTAYADGRSGYWISENDPNHRPPTDPNVMDGGGTRVRFVEVSNSTAPWNLMDSRGGQPPITHPERGVWVERKKFDCQSYLANLFGGPGAYFFDNTAGKDDLIMGMRPGNEHSHLYGSKSDASISTDVFIPEGGNIVSPNTRIPGSKSLGSSRDEDGTHTGNYILVHYAKLGSLTDVTLAIFHIDNLSPERQKDGRTRIGTIGFSGSKNYGSGGALSKKYGTKEGGHSHFELLKGPKSNLQNKTLLNFRDICP